MAEHDRLSSLLLEHWSRYHPSMLARLKQQKRLQEELEKTAEQFADLIYELVSVQKILLPEESSSMSLKESPPETSASPTPTASGWAARMKRPKRTSKPSGS